MCVGAFVSDSETNVLFFDENTAGESATLKISRLGSQPPEGAVEPVEVHPQKKRRRMKI